MQIYALCVIASWLLVQAFLCQYADENLSPEMYLYFVPLSLFTKDSNWVVNIMDMFRFPSQIDRQGYCTCVSMGVLEITSTGDSNHYWSDIAWGLKHLTLPEIQVSAKSFIIVKINHRRSSLRVHPMVDSPTKSPIMGKVSKCQDVIMILIYVLLKLIICPWSLPHWKSTALDARMFFTFCQCRLP